MNVKIIIDSTSDVTAELKEKLTVVPLTVHFGDEEYIDGVTITHKQFYEKLIETDTLPSTSQATPADFEKEFEKLKEGEVPLLLHFRQSFRERSKVRPLRQRTTTTFTL